MTERNSQQSNHNTLTKRWDPYCAAFPTAALVMKRTIDSCRERRRWRQSAAPLGIREWIERPISAPARSHRIKSLLRQVTMKKIIALLQVQWTAAARMIQEKEKTLHRNMETMTMSNLGTEFGALLSKLALRFSPIESRTDTEPLTPSLPRKSPSRPKSSPLRQASTFDSDREIPTINPEEVVLPGSLLQQQMAKAMAEKYGELDLSQDECVICMEGFDATNPRMPTLCGCGENKTYFHLPCLYQWVENGSRECPSCRVRLQWQEFWFLRMRQGWVWASLVDVSFTRKPKGSIGTWSKEINLSRQFRRLLLPP